MNRPLASILIGCLLPASLYGFSRVRTAAGEPLRLPSSRVQLVVSEGIRAAENILPGGDPLAALDAARQEWNQLSTSSVFFQPFTTSAETLARNDGINLITFSDTALFAGDAHTLATTVIFFTRSTGIVVDTDVVFNPAVKIFVTPGSEGLDLQSVATHEFGHAITADHTAVLSATMFQSSGELEFFQRSLDPDDVAFAASAFPAASRPFGSISGRVLSGGTPVFGAHVVAYEPGRNIFISGVSLLDGRYRIDSVPAGNYRVYAEPFDGPVTLDSLLSGDRQSFFGGASTAFVTTAGAGVAVSEGQNVQQVDILVPPGNATVNVTRAGRNFVRPSNLATRFLLGPGPVLAGPGEIFTLAVVGDGITAESVVSSGVQLELQGSGLRVRNRGGSTFQSGTAFLFAEIAVEEDAAPGPRQVKVTAGSQISYYTAGLVIAERDATQSAHRLAGVEQGAAKFTGIGVTNLSGSPAVVRALYYDSSGELFSIPGMENPSFFSVPAGGQVGRLTQEIFRAAHQEQGWVELQADRAQVYSFSLTGDAGTRLTGTDVPLSGLTRGIFTDVRQNAVSQTEIHLVNPNSSAATVLLRFVGLSGVQLGPVTRVVGPRASLSETAAQLFAGLTADGG
ncbi:MAG: hypothetical protein HYX74_09575, partial [Acidobacteria bacterium]|nr:hypothetical protein [Acidobacteriota bacterium]